MPMSGEQNKPAAEQAERASSGVGDFRGPYGYGRPAHKADPAAEYVFQVQPIKFEIAGPEDGTEPHRLMQAPADASVGPRRQT